MRGDGKQRVTGHLWAVKGPKQISPDSWLNQPQRSDFVESYRHVASRVATASAAFGDLTPEEIYLVWMYVQLGFALRRREARGVLR